MIGTPLQLIDQLPENITAGIIKRREAFCICIQCDANILVPFISPYCFLTPEWIQGIYIKTNVWQIDIDQFLCSVLVVVGTHGEVERLVFPNLCISNG